MRNRKAAEVLVPHYRPIYRAQMNALHSQAADLANTLYVLEKISTFPFRVFPSKHYTFWWIATKALYEACIMCAWRIAVDSGSDLLTIRHVKNEVLRNIPDLQVRQELTRELKSLEFDKTLKDIQHVIREYRHRRLAHFRFDTTVPEGDKTNAVPRPFGQDLDKVSSAIGQMINTLGFEMEYAFLLSDYDPRVIHPKHSNHQPDIEMLLDEEARSSKNLRLPESDPERWEILREKYSEAEMLIFNQYRLRFGLPRCS